MCDKWIHTSVKDCERKDRDKSKQTYCVKGPVQKRPTNWLDALKYNNPSFGPILKKQDFLRKF